MLEYEHQYEVDADFALPDLAGVKGVADVGEPVEHSLVATYFDTPTAARADSGPLDDPYQDPNATQQMQPPPVDPGSPTR